MMSKKPISIHFTRRFSNNAVYYILQLSFPFCQLSLLIFGINVGHGHGPLNHWVKIEGDDLK